MPRSSLSWRRLSQIRARATPRFAPTADGRDVLGPAAQATELGVLDLVDEGADLPHDLVALERHLPQRGVLMRLLDKAFPVVLGGLAESPVVPEGLPVGLPHGAAIARDRPGGSRGHRAAGHRGCHRGLGGACRRRRHDPVAGGSGVPHSTGGSRRRSAPRSPSPCPFGVIGGDFGDARLEPPDHRHQDGRCSAPVRANTRYRRPSSVSHQSVRP
jgi:hypothetical protein